jgi:hypothetical protein
MPSSLLFNAETAIPPFRVLPTVVSLHTVFVSPGGSSSTVNQIKAVNSTIHQTQQISIIQFIDGVGLK